MAKFHIKKASDGQYYWTLVSTKNGKTIGKCSEYHPKKETALKSVLWMKINAAKATIVDDTVK